MLSVTLFHRKCVNFLPAVDQEAQCSQWFTAGSFKSRIVHRECERNVLWGQYPSSEKHLSDRERGCSECPSWAADIFEVLQTAFRTFIPETMISWARTPGEEPETIRELLTNWPSLWWIPQPFFTLFSGLSGLKLSFQNNNLQQLMDKHLPVAVVGTSGGLGEAFLEYFLTPGSTFSQGRALLQCWLQKCPC